MGIGDLLLLAVGLSMDAFAVSICKGLSVKKAGLKQMATCGIWFGGFQALMPLIGINMLREALSKGEEEANDDMSIKTMFVMAVATSIDALAVGISLAMAGNVNIWAAIACIGVITFLMSGLGVKIGNVFGAKFEKKAEAAGGVILILLGLKILLEHLGVL